MKKNEYYQFNNLDSNGDTDERVVDNLSVLFPDTDRDVLMSVAETHDTFDAMINTLSRGCTCGCTDHTDCTGMAMDRHAGSTDCAWTGMAVDRQINRHADRQVDRHADSTTCIRADRQINRHGGSADHAWTGMAVDRQINRHTDRQMDRHADRTTCIRADRQMNRHTGSTVIRIGTGVHHSTDCARQTYNYPELFDNDRLTNGHESMDRMNRMNRMDRMDRMDRMNRMNRQTNKSTNNQMNDQMNDQVNRMNRMNDQVRQASELRRLAMHYHALATASQTRAHAHHGMLRSYHSDISDEYRRMARMADRQAVIRLMDGRISSDRMDMHGLHVSEGVMVLQDHLRRYGQTVHVCVGRRSVRLRPRLAEYARSVGCVVENDGPWLVLHVRRR